MIATLAILLVLVAIIIGLAHLAKLLKRQHDQVDTPTANTRWPYEVHPVLTRTEQGFYHRIVKALPDHIVLAQVQVSRVLRVDDRRPDAVSWRNRVDRLSFDYLVSSHDARPLLAIELDDRSHDRPSRRKTDEKKDRACRDAGLKLVRWRVEKMPDEAAIRAALPGTPQGSRLERHAGSGSCPPPLPVTHT